MDSGPGARYPAREFRSVTCDFTLDRERPSRRTGYRPLWRIARPDTEPLLVGMCEMTLIEAVEVRGGETCRATFKFWPGVQGYIEELGPGDQVDICDGGQRVGSVRVVEFVY